MQINELNEKISDYSYETQNIRKLTQIHNSNKR
jgi:hypothetical protein